MTVLLVLIIILLAALVASIYLLGFRLGGEHWQSELSRVRQESAHGQRQIHELTRQAFVAMAEEAERRRGS